MRTLGDVSGRREAAPAVPAVFEGDESFCSNLFMSLQRCMQSDRRQQQAHLFSIRATT
jgi:hypothetical protein